MASNSVFYEWLFLSCTTHRFLAVNEYGKVCIEPTPKPNTRWIPHTVSMPSAHLIIRLQNAHYPKYYIKIDRPSNIPLHIKSQKWSKCG